MPELPEVETMRRGVAAVVGRTIARFSRAPCPHRPIVVRPRIDAMSRRLVGRRVDSVERAGKRVVLLLDSGDRWVYEPRMTGLVLLADPPDQSHLRLRMEFDGSPDLQLLIWDRRGLSTARLLAESEFADELGPDRLGPDALSVPPNQLATRLGNSSRAIKVALLDQRSLAGIGNLYASEILHAARVDPRKACCDLDTAQWSRLHRAMLHILEEAIRYEGSTLSDGTYRNALNRAGSYQNHHRVYDRAGQSCLRCAAGVVQRIVQAQRSTFFCPVCQT
jgi:formamidopyrimidine-DNA glycosylase